MIGSVAVRLRSIPTSERMAAMHDIAPQLIQAGVTPQELQGIDLSDRALDGRIALSMDADKILAGIRQDAQFSETLRHNRVSEGQGSARIGIAQSAQGLAREREARIKKWGPQAIILGGVRSDTSDLDY